MNRGPLRIGAWEVHPDLNAICSAAGSRLLQPRSMDVLMYLADRPGQVVSHDALLADVWHSRLTGDDTVHRRIADLRRQLADDARNPAYIQTVPKRGYRLIAEVGPVVQAAAAVDTSGGAKIRNLRFRLLALLFGVAALAAAATLVVQSRADAAARGRAITQAQRLLDGDHHQAAYEVIRPWAGDTGDAHIGRLLQAILLPATVKTEPPGVTVAYRAPDEAAWTALGTSPIVDRLLPRGSYTLRLGEDVLLTVTHPGVTLNSAGVAERVVQMPEDVAPADMAFVPAGRYRFGAWGVHEEWDLGGFLIDRLEVTNAQYQQFVDAGGYQDPRFWQPLIDTSGGALSWDTVAARFVDRTGRPGPAAWELGAYPPGSARLPVTGVSWYEAQAYLASRDQVLPTAHHWLRAALGPMEWKYPLAPQVVPHSNLAGGDLLPAGALPGNAINGAWDLLGNAREWTASPSRRGMVVMGGSFREPAWSYNFPAAVDALYRADDLGFRGMRHTSRSLPAPAGPIELFDDLAAPIRQVSDAVFEGMTYQYAYRPGMLRADQVEVVSEVQDEHWTLRRVLIPTERIDDPLPVLVYLPRRTVGPLQSVIYLPPADSWSPGFRTEDVRLERYQIDFVPRSGRALIWPVLSGSHERYDGFHAVSGEERVALAVERNRRVRNEIGRLLDYLAESPEFDGGRVGLMGLSHGALMAAYVLALEPRVRTAILYSAGIAPPNPVFANPQNDPNLYWARVVQPTLIVNGRYDPLRPHQRIVEPLLALLATPPADKAAVLLDGAHWPLPRGPMVRASLDWLDRYLGPVPVASAAAGR